MRPPPLAGLRVIDLSRLLPGPAATLHLADLGAQVIKVEDTGAGDYSRHIGAMNGESSYFFQLLNRNKRSLTLDLKQAEGVAILQRLVTEADVLVEGFRPGVMDKLGVGYAALSAINPRLVYCAITGYGQDGPYAQRAGHDINYMGYTGVLDQIGVAGGPPAVPNFQIADLLGGALTPLLGMLAAVIDARASGRGRMVDVAMTDAVFAHAYFPLLGYLARRRVPARGADMLSGGVPCYGVYATADQRHLAVGALEPKFWQLLCDTLQRPDLKPLGLATGAQGESVHDALAAIFASRSQAEWVALFDGVDCCVTPVLRIDESLDNPQLRARAMVHEVDGLTQFAPPCHFSEFTPLASRPAPQAGADNESILRDLGYGDEQIAGFRARHVV